MQLRRGGFSFEMTIERDAVEIDRYARILQDQAPTVLRAMGVQAVSWVMQDYRDRSQGRAAGGIAWQDITDAAIRSRLAGRTPWQRMTEEKKSIAKQNADYEATLKRMRGDRSESARNTRQRIEQDRQKLSKKRKSIESKRAGMVAKEKGQAKIGVDTGRLVNSLVAGRPELASIRAPVKSSDAPTALFTLSGNSITIGSILKYAGYFDERRPIFAPSFISSERRAAMDRLIEQVVQKLTTGGNR